MQRKSVVVLLGLSVVGMSLSWMGTASGNGLPGDTEYEGFLAKYAPAVVTVKYVSKTSDGDGDYENEDEFYGLMIDPAGLVLCSSSRMGSGEWGGQTIPKDIKVLAGDDTEGAPAKVLARDSELDLIWIKVTAPGDRKFASVDLQHAASPRLGDRILSIERKTNFYDRAPVVSEDRIGGILKKPRDLYAASRGLFSDIGMPVFTLDGGLVGVFVAHAPESSSLDAGESSWTDTDYLILPTVTILKATAQARRTGASTSRPTDVEEDEEEE